MRYNILTMAIKQWAWWIRFAILGIALSLLHPATFRLQMDAPQTVYTAHPSMCVHTDLIHEVDEWKIQRTLQLVREMGAPTIVEFFPWAYLEPKHGQYNWLQADRIVRHAQNQGIKVIARMGLVPQWARPDRTPSNTLPDTAFENFADFVETFAARYAGAIDTLILWNEPNLAFEWGFEDFSAARYVHLLEAVYPRAKRGNPNVTILAGALAPTLEPATSPNGINDLRYLQAMYEAGAAAHFDALAVHTYGFNQPAAAEPAFDQLNFRRAELLREIMIEYGDADKPVYITESGWNDNPRWTYGVRPSRRVAYTLEAFQQVESNWDWAETLCLWIFRHPTPRNSYRDNFTLMTPDFQAKPIYAALRDYALGQQGDAPLWLPPPEEESP